MADLTAAERQRRKRQRDADAGWKVVRVRIPADREEDLKAFVASLGEPSNPQDDDDRIQYLPFDGFDPSGKGEA